MVVAFIALLAAAAAAAATSPLVERQSSLSSFISKERSIALDGAIANIGGSGSELIPGAFPGIVVAAPSTFNPNYFYTWTRDSALTFTMLIDELILGNNSLQYLIDDYVRAQAILQTIANPSGTLYPAGLGLGEPKFYTNDTRFDGDWGRPQRDGPALRSIALMDYCNYLLSQGQKSMVKNTIWPIILNDLKYVGQYWNQTGYDLWEEVRIFPLLPGRFQDDDHRIVVLIFHQVHGSSFFTINNQHRALTQGMLLAKKIGEKCAPCGQAPQILCFLSNDFWNGTGGYLTANLNVNNVNRSGINSDVILGSIHVFDINATCDAASESTFLFKTLNMMPEQLARTSGAGSISGVLFVHLTVRSRPH
jgi:glucoamylase